MIERDETGNVIHYRGANSSPKCEICPCAVNGKPKPKGVVPGFGAKGGLVVVGEAPSTEEFRQGFPFVGPSGKELNRCFKRGGIDRQSVYITNSLLCQRPVGEGDMMRALTCCQPRLESELQALEPTAVLALGATATRALRLRATTITDARGTVQESPLVPGVPVVTSLHPASLFKGGAGEVSGGKNKSNVDAQAQFLQSDVEKAWGISEGVIPPTWSDDIVVIGPETPPEQINLAMMTVVSDARAWTMVGLDLEWAKDGRITWLGLGTALRAFSFWFPTLTKEALQAATNLLADPGLPKVIHNKQADVDVWERELDAPVLGEPCDTMLAHHAAYPGLAHDLQQVVSQFIPVPPWKTWRAQQLKEAIEGAKARAKEEKKAAKQAAHEARNAERARIKEEKKAEKQRAHDERVAAQQAARDQKKAERQAAHDARNAGKRKKGTDATDAPQVPAGVHGDGRDVPLPPAPGPDPAPPAGDPPAVAPQVAPPPAPVAAEAPRGQLTLLSAPDKGVMVIGSDKHRCAMCGHNVIHFSVVGGVQCNIEGCKCNVWRAAPPIESLFKGPQRPAAPPPTGPTSAAAAASKRRLAIKLADKNGVETDAPPDIFPPEHR